MVYAIRFLGGPLIRVNNASKARARAAHLLRKPRYAGQIPFFVRAASAEALRTGDSVERVLRVDRSRRFWRSEEV